MFIHRIALPLYVYLFQPSYFCFTYVRSLVLPRYYSVHKKTRSDGMLTMSKIALEQPNHFIVQGTVQYNNLQHHFVKMNII